MIDMLGHNIPIRNTKPIGTCFLIDATIIASSNLNCLGKCSGIDLHFEKWLLLILLLQNRQLTSWKSIKTQETFTNPANPLCCIIEESFPHHWHHDAVTLPWIMRGVMATTATFVWLLTLCYHGNNDNNKRPEKFRAPDRVLYSWLLSELQKKRSQTAFCMDENPQIDGSERWLCLS